jgi:23S rRNA (guanine2445-N2)-methyltransferase / 23S rRNA (guanine2069-N7)-methyltransferase
LLNLFAYTCTASVAAAAGGAARVTSVDLSRTYLDWGRRNFERNGLAKRAMTFHQGDVMDFVTHCRERFDLIYCAPPLSSTSKRAPGFHLAEDIGPLAVALRRLLTPGGTLYLSLPGTQHAEDLGLAGLPDLRDLTVRCADSDVAAPRTPFTLFTLGH